MRRRPARRSGLSCHSLPSASMISLCSGQRKSGVYSPRGLFDVGSDEAAFVEEVEHRVLEFRAGRCVAVGEVVAELGLVADLLDGEAFACHRFTDGAAVVLQRQHRGEVGQRSCRGRDRDAVEADDLREVAGAVDDDAGDVAGVCGGDGDVDRRVDVPRGAAPRGRRRRSSERTAPGPQALTAARKRPRGVTPGGPTRRRPGRGGGDGPLRRRRMIASSREAAGAELVDVEHAPLLAGERRRRARRASVFDVWYCAT